jgi:O-antigen/teichoic acid export membrane protein
MSDCSHTTAGGVADPPHAASGPGPAPRSRLGAHVTAIAGANAAVAGLGFVGNNLLLGHALDVAAFAAVSLYLAAFQCLQEVMGKSLNWALLRLTPQAADTRHDGGASMIAAASSLRRRFAVAGLLAVAVAALLLRPVLDVAGAPSRALMIALAGAGAALAVLFQFGLGMLQLRERFAAFSAWMVGNSGLRLLVWSLLYLLGVLDLPTAVGAHLLSSAAIALAIRRAAGPLGAHPPAQLAADRARLLQFGGRMVLATSLAATAAQIDLFVLDAMAGDAETARYRIATQVAIVLELGTSSVMTALLPQAGRARTPLERGRVLRRAAVCGVLIAALALLSLPVVEFALPRLLPKYAAATALYPTVLIGVVCTALTDPLGLAFVSRDRPGRFVALNALLLAVVLIGNLCAPGADRAQVAAWVRSGGRLVLALGILFLLWRDARAARGAPAPQC